MVREACPSSSCSSPAHHRVTGEGVPHGVPGDIVELRPPEGMPVGLARIADLEHPTLGPRLEVDRAAKASALIGTSGRLPDLVSSSRRTPRVRSTRSQVSPYSSASRSPVFSARTTPCRSSRDVERSQAASSATISSSVSQRQLALRLTLLANPRDGRQHLPFVADQEQQVTQGGERAVDRGRLLGLADHPTSSLMEQRSEKTPHSALGISMPIAARL